MSGRLVITQIEDYAPDTELMQDILREQLGGELDYRFFAHFREGFESLEARMPDVLILDLSLPDASGLDGLLVIHERYPALPVIVATGRGGDALALEALRRGAQDFVFKGELDGAELLKKILFSIERAKIIGRLKSLAQPAAEEAKLRRGPLWVDLAMQEAFVDQRPGNTSKLDLTRLELKLLIAFLRSWNRPLSRDELASLLWGKGTAVSERAIDSHTSHLRAKLRATSYTIQSVRGVGYQLIEESSYRQH